MSEDNAIVRVSEGALATMDAAPEAVLTEAQKAASALKDVIAQKPKPVIMGGEQYLEFEDWQTLGRFYGITAGEEHEPEYVELGSVRGFKATAVALFQNKVISRATAYCLSDEEKWGERTKYEYHMALKNGGTAREEESDKSEWVWEPNPRKPDGKRPKRVKVKAGTEAVPLFQLASMAQTRANAKVLRNVLSWVAVLAGYRPTPAEEMSGTLEAEVVEPKKERKAAGKGKPAEAQEQIEDAAAKSGCRHCGSMEVVVDPGGKSAHCEDCAKGWVV